MSGKMLVFALVACSCSRVLQEPADEVVQAPPSVHQFALGLIPMSGSVGWSADVMNELLIDKLVVAARGLDSTGVFHTLDGNINLSDRGDWVNGKWVFSKPEGLREQIGALDHFATRQTEEGQEAVATEPLVPVEMNFEIREAGTLLAGTVILHPSVPSLFSAGRSPQLEIPLSLNGPIAWRACTVLVTSAPAQPGEPSRNVVTGDSHQLCTERFGGP